MNLKDNPEETKFITAILFNEVFNKELKQILKITDSIQEQMINRCKEKAEHLDASAMEDIESALMDSLFLALAIKKQKIENGE